MIPLVLIPRRRAGPDGLATRSARDPARVYVEAGGYLQAGWTGLTRGGCRFARAGTVHVLPPVLARIVLALAVRPSAPIPIAEIASVVYADTPSGGPLNPSGTFTSVRSQNRRALLALGLRIRAPFGWGLELTLGNPVLGARSAPQRGPNAARPGPTLDRAWLTDAAERLGCTAAEILGPSRRGDIAAARQAIMWRMRHELQLSTYSIGRLLGGREHATVIHGLRRHRERQQYLAQRQAARPTHVPAVHSIS